MSEDFSDIENFVLSPWGPATAVDKLRPLYSKCRRWLGANGVERLSVHDALGANLMTEFIRDHMPKAEWDHAASHDHRNLLWAQGAPMLRGRGWKA